MVNADFGAAATAKSQPGWNEQPATIVLGLTKGHDHREKAGQRRYNAQVFAAAVLSVLPATAVVAADDRVSPEERARVLEAVAAAGCSEPKEVERKNDGYEAEDAQCTDGRYDLRFDRDFELISRDRED